MHVGVTQGGGLARPFLELDSGLGGGRPEGAVSADGKVAGCYLHGLFADDGFRAAFLGGLKARATRSAAHTSELQSLMRIPYSLLCLQKHNTIRTNTATKQRLQSHV